MHSKAFQRQPAPPGEDATSAPAMVICGQLWIQADAAGHGLVNPGKGKLGEHHLFTNLAVVAAVDLMEQRPPDSQRVDDGYSHHTPLNREPPL